ncbi:multipass membrane protein [Candidatus Mancarchaeum acidiphilum]|uniref:Multipass membrane protein n=1 Tax=Candidatus Mancarchaeum acidiphilum TaxID=1920749 RepID=A0A218NNJ5_9ARCH|nr:hypothetical protein [Candidatus Mancarchaeum acidiphilum]ASI14026.1 multipass membrane protein [Candidatus Mancarchaeum acidiphilum]
MGHNVISFVSAQQDKIRLLALLGAVIFGFASMTAGATSYSNVTNTICGVYTEIKTIVFILGLVLVILGAIMYAVGHVLPATSRGSIQGYGTGMIMAGIIAVIIAVLAPYILSTIGGNAYANAIASCS